MTSKGKIDRVIFTNARSYAGDQTLDLEPGMNVIVGPSDAGKSNIPRNFMSLVFNDSFDALATHGKNRTEIAVHFDDGSSVTLRKTDPVKSKGKAVNAYTIDDATGKHDFTSVGVQVPDQVAAALRLGDIDLSGEELPIHFATQHGNRFIVDDTPSRVARIIGAVSGLDVLYRAASAADKSRKDAEADQRATRTAFDVARDVYRKTRDGAAAELESLEAKRVQLSVVLDRAEGLETRRARLATAIEQTESAKSRKFYASVSKNIAENNRDRLKRAWDKIVPMVKSVEAIRKFTTEVTVRANVVRSRRKDLEDARAVLRSAQDALSAYEATLEKCPRCGQFIEGSDACSE